MRDILIASHESKEAVVFFQPNITTQQRAPRAYMSLLMSSRFPLV